MPHAANRSIETDDRLATLVGDMQSQSLAPLWDLYTKIVTHEPVAVEPSHIWRWRDLLPLVEESAHAVRGDLADHRVLLLRNPSIADKIVATSNIVAGVQCVLPGELTIEHRHTAAACRLILEGNGGGTFVDGKRCPMNTFDFILTPNWTWHNHDNDSAERAIWIDLLDIPLVRMLDANFGGQGPVEVFPVNLATAPDATFASSGIRAVTDRAPMPYSPKAHYPWRDVEAVLDASEPAADGSKTVEYVDPTTGGAAMPTINGAVLELRSGSETRPQRVTSNALCIVLEGEGRSQIGEIEHRWAPRDIFTIPHWSWAAHRAVTNRGRLLVLSDREVYRRLGMLKTELAA